MYNMAYTVFVIMTDKRYGSEKTQIAQFDIEDDAILFIKARQELEANTK